MLYCAVAPVFIRKFKLSYKPKRLAFKVNVIQVHNEICIMVLHLHVSKWVNFCWKQGSITFPVWRVKCHKNVSFGNHLLEHWYHFSLRSVNTLNLHLRTAKARTFILLGTFREGRGTQLIAIKWNTFSVKFVRWTSEIRRYWISSNQKSTFDEKQQKSKDTTAANET